MEFSTLVISSAEHLAGEPAMLFKAYYRRASAFEKLEKYASAKADLEVCRKMQPYNLDVTKALNRMKEALDHEEKMKKAQNMITPQKLIANLEEFKEKGNT